MTATGPTQPRPSVEADVPQVPSRRAVLRTGAVIGLAGAAVPLLAACGEETAAEGTGVDGTASATPSQTAGSVEPDTGGTIVAAAEVPVAGSVVKIVDDRKIIVTQPVAGEFKAFSAVCTHSSCTVKGIEPEDGLIRCVCHESRFDPTTGAVVQGPAQAPLAAIPVTVANGDVDFA